MVTPVRQWHWNREEEIEFAKKHNIDIPIDLDSPYSIDANIWGRANECGVLENPWNQAPEDAFDITKPIEETPDQPEFMDITFKQGKPVAVNGVEMSFVDVIKKVNIVAGEHGVGRIDHIENRLVGIKSREVYEAPGATVLLKAHKAMENLTMERDLAHFKPMIEQQIANLTYNGLWFSPLMKSLKAFIQSSQDTVSGTVKVKLFKGNVYVVASKSEESLYDEDLATYTAADSFDQNASVGFIKLWGLPTQVASQVKQKNLQKNFMKDVMKTQTKEKVLVENKLEGESDE